MAVDIGVDVANFGGTCVSSRTHVNKDHPAESAGTIGSIEIWADSDITGLIVGTFYTTNGNTLKCRASQAIPGTITAGSKVEKPVSIAVEIGDYIGCYFTGGSLDRELFIYAGRWEVSAQEIDPGDEAVYNLNADQAMALGGYFEEVAKGRSFGFIMG